MFEELVERLRAQAEADRFFTGEEMLYLQAADAIEKLSMKLHGDEAAIAGMKREIERMVVAGKPRWIPVTERLPEDGSDILAVHSYCGEVLIVPANYDRGVWYDCVFNRVAEHVTHWMPLPSTEGLDET